MTQRVEGFIAACGEAGYPIRPRETYRSPERQAWLYGIGRDYDPDGRGNPYVTNARTGKAGWHAYRLAVDFEDLHGNDPHGETLATMRACAATFGLALGADWLTPDVPHAQAVELPKSPDAEDQACYLRDDIAAVADRYGLA